MRCLNGLNARAKSLRRILGVRFLPHLNSKCTHFVWRSTADVFRIHTNNISPEGGRERGTEEIKARSEEDCVKKRQSA